MRILVTGRHGQLAQSLVEQAAGDHRIKLLMAGRPDVDLSVEGSARSALLAARPDLVINAAAFTAVDLAETDEAQSQRVNGDAAGEIAAAARDIGAPVIQISTDYVFDGETAAPYDEQTEPHPINAYGRTKLAGEEAVRASNPDHLILRTSWLFSPFGRNFVRTMNALGRERDTLTVVADQRGNPTSSADLAEALLLLARRFGAGDRTGLGETWHLAGTGVATWYELAVAVQAERTRLGVRSAAVEPIASSDWPTAARRPANSALDSGKFARTYGFTMPDWHVSLRPVVERIVGQT